jgi:adenylate cyclase
MLPLGCGDCVQIGLHQVAIEHRDSTISVSDSNSKRLENVEALAINSLDPRTDLMYRAAHCLNNVEDSVVALRQVCDLIRESLSAAVCTLIRNEDANPEQLEETVRYAVAQAGNCGRGVIVPDLCGAPDSCDRSVSGAPRTTALCVPVTRGTETKAFIYLERAVPPRHPFCPDDLKLIEAVSHMVALTIERPTLSERINEEQKLKALLQGYLTPSRVDELLQNYLRTGRLPGLAEQQATVLFADIADSTKMAERLGARLFGESLQRYYEDMTRIVSNHQGFLEKYLGDGVMAVFGMADGNTTPEHCAVRAGLAMLSFVENHYDFRADNIKIGVGINTGPVVAGYVRTHGRVDFTILGDTVNVAHGLQSLARPNRLLIGPATFEQVAPHFSTQDLGTTVLKGREEPLEVHEVIRCSATNLSHARSTPKPVVI